MTVTIGEHSVVCINDKRKIVLAVDDDTVNFIRHWLLPLVQKYVGNVAPVMKMVRSKSQDTLQQQDSQTSEESMPKKIATSSWQNKVIWSPSQIAWLVKAKNVAKDTKFIEQFPVDADLRGHRFSLTRDSQFLLAVAEWNKCDGSKRERIELPEGFGDAEAEFSSGLQPSAMESLNTESGLHPSPMAHRWMTDDGM